MPPFNFCFDKPVANAPLRECVARQLLAPTRHGMGRDAKPWPRNSWTADVPRPRD